MVALIHIHWNMVLVGVILVAISIVNFRMLIMHFTVWSGIAVHEIEVDLEWTFIVILFISKRNIVSHIGSLVRGREMPCPGFLSGVKVREL